MKLRKNPNKNVVRAANEFKAWNYVFMLALEEEALKSFSKNFETNGITRDNPITARDCRLMLQLLTIANSNNDDGYNSGKHRLVKLEDGNYRIESLTEATMNKYVNLRNARRFIKNCDGSAAMRKYLREQKAWYLYNKLRYYRLQVSLVIRPC